MAFRRHSAADTLQSVPFFSELNPLETNELARKLVPRRFSSGQIIFHHGDPGGLLYIITHGKVKITFSTPDGQEALLAILGRGDFFGELALLDDSPRSATAESLVDTETQTLHRWEFMDFIRENPDFSLHVLQTLAQNIRRLNMQLSDVFFLDVPARLARTLLHLSEQHGRETDEGIVIDLSLTQTDLAEMTGSTRVSINKALGRFRRNGWVKAKGRKFTVLNREGLLEQIQLSGGSI